MAAERGFVYCPAIRPTLTIGTCAAYVSTTAIDSRVRSLPWMLAAVTPSNVSAQSPPCRMNDSPAATLAILLAQAVALTGKHQRRERAQPGDDLGDLGRVVVRRLLQRVERVELVHGGNGRVVGHPPTVDVVTDQQNRIP